MKDVMAFYMLLLLITLIPEIIGNTYLEDSICNPIEIVEFQEKYCYDQPNITELKKDDFTTAFITCYDEGRELFGIGSKYQQKFGFLSCEEINDCLGSKRDIIAACGEIVGRVLPPELTNPGDPASQRTLIELITRIRKKNMEFSIALWIMFVIGIVGNGLLLIIFQRHKKARNDVMLVNLTLADMLSLFINLPILSVIIHFHLNFTDLFKVFTFGSRVCIFASEYSLVIISFERFRAVTKIIDLKKTGKFPNWIKITGLWLVGTIYGFFSYLFIEAVISNWIGFWIVLKLGVIYIYIMFCIEGILPVVLIVIFSLLASKKLNEHARNFPGERGHNLQLIKNRYLAAKALIALTALFLISYLPYHIVLLTMLDRYISFENTVRNILKFESWWNLFTSAYIVMFLNSALNPVILYFVSSKFRNYFKCYLRCRAHELREIPEIPVRQSNT